ncbi:hypothetical protein A0J61_09087, partial [Choanephora cucurbitarum]
MHSDTRKKKQLWTVMTHCKAVVGRAGISLAFVATASLSYRLGQLTSIFADLGPSAREETKKQTKKERRKLNLIEFGLSRTLSSTTSPVSPTAT